MLHTFLIPITSTIFSRLQTNSHQDKTRMEYLIIYYFINSKRILTKFPITDSTQYAATSPDSPRRRILTDCFNDYNFN